MKKWFINHSFPSFKEWFGNSFFSLSIVATISSPEATYRLYRNPRYKNGGNFMKLSDFLVFAKDKALSGVLISIEVIISACSFMFKIDEIDLNAAACCWLHQSCFLFTGFVPWTFFVWLWSKLFNLHYKWSGHVSRLWAGSGHEIRVLFGPRQQALSSVITLR